MRYPVPVGVYDPVVTAPGRADACVHVRSGTPTRKYTLVRKAGGAVKTLELDVGLGDFVAPMSTVPELVGRRSP